MGSKAGLGGPLSSPHAELLAQQSSTGSKRFSLNPWTASLIHIDLRRMGVVEIRSACWDTLYKAAPRQHQVFLQPPFPPPHSVLR